MNQDASFLKGLKVIAYIRVSNETSDPERQRSTILNWAEKSGVSISLWFEDTEGRNPRDESEKRVKFQQMLGLIEMGGISAVIVDSIERLGFKDQHEFGYFIHRFRKSGCVGWSTVEGNLSAVDPGSIFQNTAKAISSSIDQANIARRNLDQKAVLARKGQYQGGYPPFGFDVVCFEKGVEIWRVIYDGGHHKRIKVSVDGTRLRYDGKGNFPSRDKEQELMVRPSIEFSGRLDVVKEVFQWVKEEGVSPAQIATRLNQRGAKPQVGLAWNKVVIKSLLRNPVYTGFPTFNKRAAGKYAEWTDGSAKPALVSPGEVRPKAGRRRLHKDWIAPPTVQFEPIVDEQLFNDVQEKLDASSEKHKALRAPRVASFWLRDILICAKCQKPMRAWNEKGWRSYFCGTYGTFGKVNPTGCRCHRVRADLIESIVMEYLEEIGQKVVVLQSSKNQIPQNLLTEASLAHSLEIAAWSRLKAFVSEFLDDGEQWIVLFGNQIPIEKFGDEIRLPAEFSIFDLYGHFSERKRVEIEKQIALKESEFEKLLREFRELRAQLAKDQVNKEMILVESQINSLKDQLQPLDDEARETYRESLRLLDGLALFRKAYGEGNDRRKAAAAKVVVKEVLCYFNISDTKAANKPKSILERIEIFPLVGESRSCYPNGNTPGQG